MIAYKVKDVRFPSKERISDMWDANPDGAGIMWRDGKTNRIRFVKGFMSLKKFGKWVKRNRKWLEGVECALHFRITTHGGTSPGNCHPFVCDDESDPHLLKGEADFVLMHNGILNVVPRSADISDSAELALRVGRYEDPMDCLGVFGEQLAGNRVICMGPKGTKMYGDAWKDCCGDGILYSNDHFVGGGWCSSYACMKPKEGDGKSGVGKPGGWWWDAVRMKWFDMFGREAAVEDVDPDFLSMDDYDEWCAQTGTVDSEEAYMRQMEREAEYYGMEVGDYIDMVNGGGVE